MKKYYKHGAYALVGVCTFLSGVGSGYLIFRGGAPQPDTVYASSCTDYQDLLQMAMQHTFKHIAPVPSRAAVVEEAPQYRYKVTAVDGYITVLDLVQNTIYMETTWPIAPFREEEQARLVEGIYIVDEDALFRILEDYSS